MRDDGGHRRPGELAGERRGEGQDVRDDRVGGQLLHERRALAGRSHHRLVGLERARARREDVVLGRRSEGHPRGLHGLAPAPPGLQRHRVAALRQPPAQRDHRERVAGIPERPEEQAQPTVAQVAAVHRPVRHAVTRLPRRTSAILQIRSGLCGVLVPGTDAMTRAIDQQSWDARLAARSGAALFLLGAVLLVTIALPQAHPPPLAATVAVGAAAAAAGVVLLVLERRGRATLDVAFAFNLSAVALIAVLVAPSGGSSSLYAEYYLFALVHTAAFQSRRRVLGMVAVSTLAFLSPLAYDEPDAAFATLAIVAIPPVVVAVAAVHAAMEALRAQHHRLERREAHALALADQDPLTSLANYRVFQREIEAWARDESAGFSLVLLDLDGFKSVNDEIGHQMGDAVLRAVAAELRHAVRADDVLCRQGGDEFAVLAPRTGVVEAPELAERLVAAVERAGGGRAAGGVTLSATCGWATFGRDASTPGALIARADAAMRAAKPSAQGPGRRVAVA